MITIKDLRKTFNQSGRPVVALDGVSLSVSPGEIYGVIGPSGAGKSTLIRCVNMLERPTSGSVQVNGQEMTALSPAELRRARQRIGMIFQHFNLLTSRTVAGNVSFPLEITGVPAAERARRVDELLALVGLTDQAKAYPAQLSGGQKQRVGIARALATQPDVLLCDEATSALDPQTTVSILDLLRDLNRRLQLTILLITHEMNVVKHICDRVAVIERGRIVEEGDVVDLVTRPNSYLSQALFPAGDIPPVRPGGVLVSAIFVGRSAEQPVLSQLVRSFAVDVNILGGSIQTIGGQRVGRLQIELAGDQVNPALEYLKNQGLRVEVHTQ